MVGAPRRCIVHGYITKPKILQQQQRHAVLSLVHQGSCGRWPSPTDEYNPQQVSFFARWMQVQEIAQDAVGRCLQGCPLQTLWSRPSAGGAPVQPLQESHRGGPPM